MPHLAEEAFHFSYLNKTHSGGLFRSELKLDADPRWTDENVRRVFDVVCQIREDFNEKIGSNNVALYELELACNKKGLDLLRQDAATTNNSNSDWLVEIFGCANVRLVDLDKKQNDESQSENFKSTQCGVIYHLNVSNIDRNTRFACMRCRRYVCHEEKSNVCERCRSVINT